MDATDLLLDLYGRIPPLAHEAVDDLSLDQLCQAPGPERNPIAWLIWHVGRIEDAQLGAALGESQLWVTGDYAGRFGLEPDPDNHGYGHSPAEVAAVRPDAPAALLEYFDAVAARTTAMLRQLSSDALDAVIDERWDPPVTLGVRLVSVADDCLQHLGQAAYVRGLLGA